MEVDFLAWCYCIWGINFRSEFIGVDYGFECFIVFFVINCYFDVVNVVVFECMFWIGFCGSVFIFKVLVLVVYVCCGINVEGVYFIVYFCIGNGNLRVG